jgi:hypothetical protein
MFYYKKKLYNYKKKIFILFIFFLLLFSLTQIKKIYNFYSLYFPQINRLLDNETALNQNIWSNKNGGKLFRKDNNIIFIEDASYGEHYVETKTFLKGNRSFITINMILETKNLSGILLRVVSPDQTSAVWFKLGQVEHIYLFGAKNGKMKLINKKNFWQKNGNNFTLDHQLKLMISGNFKIVGASNHLVIRIQGFQDGNLKYTGNQKSSLTIINTSINFQDSGKKISNIINPVSKKKLFLQDELQ